MPAPPEVSFHPFSPLHAIVVATFIVGVALLVFAGRRLRGTRRARAMDIALAVVSASVWIIMNGWWVLPERFDPRVSLPLHICDVVAGIVPFVLLWPKRWMRAVLYFWGIGLSFQGFVTPDLRDGPATIGFWMFWGNHFIVVGIAIYDLAVRGYRPGWRDYWVSVALGMVYVAAVMPLDILFDLNYGYLGPRGTGQPTLLNHVGPWPWRVGVMIGLGMAWTAVLVLPWKLARAPESERAAPLSPSDVGRRERVQT